MTNHFHVSVSISSFAASHLGVPLAAEDEPGELSIDLDKIAPFRAFPAAVVVENLLFFLHFSLIGKVPTAWCGAVVTPQTALLS